MLLVASPASMFLQKDKTFQFRHIVSLGRETNTLAQPLQAITVPTYYYQNI
jgi:hypothetical protein